jgi:hypothetical protein
MTVVRETPLGRNRFLSKEAIVVLWERLFLQPFQLKT